MCVIIDTNCLSRVFNDKNVEHEEFRPVHEWLYGASGKIVYGGTKYKTELKKLTSLFKVLIELRTSRRIIEIETKIVDEEEARVSALSSHVDFDDQHLVAIVGVSGCQLVVTLDDRAKRFLKDKKFYRTNRCAKLYTGLSNRDMLGQRKYCLRCRKEHVASRHS